jgi:hypothetical protein
VLPNVPVPIIDVGVGERSFFILRTPWTACYRDGTVCAFPSEVHLANGAVERLHARKVVLRKQLADERDAAQAARAKRAPKKKGKAKR